MQDLQAESGGFSQQVTKLRHDPDMTFGSPMRSPPQRLLRCELRRSVLLSPRESATELSLDLSPIPVKVLDITVTLDQIGYLKYLRTLPAHSSLYHEIHIQACANLLQAQIPTQQGQLLSSLPPVE